MGLLIGIMRRRELAMEKSTLEWQLLLISKAMSVATKANNDLQQVGTDYESDELISKKLQERQYKFKLLEEQLELQKGQIQTRLEEINAEIQSVNSMIKSEIQTFFSYQIS